MVKATQAIAILAVAVACVGVTWAQDPEVVPNQILAKEILPKEIQKVETEQNASAPCLEPAPVMDLQDYDGPFRKVVGAFGRKLDRKSAHNPHYKPDAVLCSLMLKDKFMLFVTDTADPISFLTAGFDAALDHVTNQDPTYGQGTAGYARRFSADFASQTTARFLMDFAYPTIFSEDPRYYRLGHGETHTRFLHAVEHTFIAHKDNGKRMVNFSEWLGTITAVVINNSYHPGNERGFGPTAQTVGFSIGTDMGLDILREFWPEISRKFKMPFRERESLIHVVGR